MTSSKIIQQVPGETFFSCCRFDGDTGAEAEEELTGSSLLCPGHTPSGLRRRLLKASEPPRPQQCDWPCGQAVHVVWTVVHVKIGSLQ